MGRAAKCPNSSAPGLTSGVSAATSRDKQGTTSSSHNAARDRRIGAILNPSLVEIVGYLWVCLNQLSNCIKVMPRGTKRDTVGIPKEEQQNMDRDTVMDHDQSAEGADSHTVAMEVTDSPTAIETVTVPSVSRLVQMIDKLGEDEASWSPDASRKTTADHTQHLWRQGLKMETQNDVDDPDSLFEAFCASVTFPGQSVNAFQLRRLAVSDMLKRMEKGQIPRNQKFCRALLNQNADRRAKGSIEVLKSLARIFNIKISVTKYNDTEYAWEHIEHEGPHKHADVLMLLEVDSNSYYLLRSTNSSPVNNVQCNNARDIKFEYNDDTTILEELKYHENDLSQWIDAIGPGDGDPFEYTDATDAAKKEIVLSFGPALEATNNVEKILAELDAKNERSKEEFINNLCKEPGFVLVPFLRDYYKMRQGKAFLTGKGTSKLSFPNNIESSQEGFSQVDFVHLTRAGPAQAAKRKQKRTVVWNTESKDLFNELGAYTPTPEYISCRVGGPPGSGKTLIAWYFARTKNNERQNVLWISAFKSLYDVIIMLGGAPGTIWKVNKCDEELVKEMLFFPCSVGNWYIFVDGVTNKSVLEASSPFSRVFIVNSLEIHPAASNDANSLCSVPVNVSHWTWDEYRKAFKDPWVLMRFLVAAEPFVPEVLNGLKSNDYKAVSVLLRLMERKYYLAGLSMRFMTDFLPDQVIKDINASVSKMKNFEEAKNMLLGTSTDTPHTVYFNRKDGDEGQFVSDYAYKVIVAKAWQAASSTKKLVELYNHQRLQTVSSAKGRLYEQLFEAFILKEEPLPLTRIANSTEGAGDWTGGKVVEYKRNAAVDWPDSANIVWLKPVAPNNHGWDYACVQVKQKLARFVQLTISESHKCELFSMDSAMKEINSMLNTDKVRIEFAFVSPNASAAVELKPFLGWDDLHNYCIPSNDAYYWPSNAQRRSLQIHVVEDENKKQRDYVTFYHFPVKSE